jgi:hypothetical protein
MSKKNRENQQRCTMVMENSGGLTLKKLDEQHNLLEQTICYNQLQKLLLKVI